MNQLLLPEFYHSPGHSGRVAFQLPLLSALPAGVAGLNPFVGEGRADQSAAVNTGPGKKFTFAIYKNARAHVVTRSRSVPNWHKLLRRSVSI